MKTILKPVTFIKGEYPYHRDNKFQQNLLLRALQVTTNPEDLRKMAGFRNTAEVLRTLDKLAIRKEYHEALSRNGIDLDSIVAGIKDVTNSVFAKGETKLRAYQILLKSLGLDEYKESASDAGKNWEDAIKEQLNKEKKVQIGEYDVIIPEIPETERKKIELERQAGKGLYE